MIKSGLKLILIAIFAAVGQYAIGQTGGAPLHPGAPKHWIIFDMNTRATNNPTQALTMHYVCELPPPYKVDTRCHEWKPDEDYFESGTLIYIVIAHPQNGSSYSVNQNGVQIAEDRPNINGAGSTPPTPSPAPTQTENLTAGIPNIVGPLVLLYGETVNQLSQSAKILDRFYVRQDSSKNPVLSSDEKLDQTIPSCAGQAPHYSGAETLTALLTHVNATQEAVGTCLSSTTRAVTWDQYTSLQDNLAELNRQFKAYNERLASQQQEVQSAAQTFEDAFNKLPFLDNKFKEICGQPVSNEPAKPGCEVNPYPTPAEIQSYGYLDNGVKSAKEDNDKITKQLAAIADSLNALYSKAAPGRDLETVFLGQYTSNEILNFTVCESARNSNTAVGLPCANSTSSSQGNDKTSNSQSKTPACSCCNCQQPAPPQSKNNTLVAKDRFEVHKMYRANIVAGFFVSSLRNRQYGLTNNGQTPSSVTFVTVNGPITRPQYHAFTAVNIYWFKRDVFPGAMGKQGFLWEEPSAKTRWLNGYWNPGISVGYGVDSLNNYLVGLNWEIPWGITLGSGLHIGQEAFLQPGVVAGVTQFSSSTTSVPTINRTKNGWYGSVGFDLGVMKAAFSQLLGGGSSTVGK